MKNNMSSEQKIVTRFAPSPTGLLHLGTYRTAIFSYLYAKAHGGTFVLRIEDTDRERNKKEYEENILESLRWLGLPYDVFVRQSEKADIHKKYMESMIADGSAYISKEEAKDGSGVIKELVRFRNPNIDVTFHDEIKGQVTMNTTELGDFVIAKNINEPLFHLAVVIDDYEAGITHVIRGEDHTSNTPRQILIQRAIGAPTPIYAHLPLVLGPDKLKLSKRRGALPILSYRDLGYLPEAVLNGIAFIGWNPGTTQEIFTHDELVATFELSKVQKSPAMFNEEKFSWFNKEHIKRLPYEVLEEKMLTWLPDTIKNLPKYDSKKYKKIIPILLDRITKFGDLTDLAQAGEIAYFFETPVYETKALIWKTLVDDREGVPTTEIHLKKSIELLSSLAEEISTEEAKAALWPYAEASGRGVVLWPLRFALSGRDKSPDPFTLVSVLGKAESIARITTAIVSLQTLS